MSDIEHWIDGDAPDEVRELLRAARVEAPRKRAVDKAIAAVGALSATGTLATAASGAALGPAGKLIVLLKWGIGGALSGVVVVGGMSLARDAMAPAESPVPALPGASAPARVPSARPEPTAAVHSEPAASAVPVAPPASIAKVATPRPSATFDGLPGPDPRLAAELALIDRARAAVDAKDGARALAELSKHEQQFGRSARLLPEARYLRLEALLLTQDRSGAEAQARKILTEDPHSPHSRRAESVLKQNR
jgi:hypothetical protein